MSSESESDFSERTFQPRGSLDLVEASILETIIPANTNLGIEEQLGSSIAKSGNGNTSPLGNIKQRQSLFFDETVNVFVALQTPYFEEAALRSYLARLVIVLEAQVANLSNEHDGPMQREVIYSASVQEVDKEEPLIIIREPDNEGDDREGQILLVWKLPVLLSRPQRLRPQNPSVTFSATANLKYAEQMDDDVVEDEYMQSSIPAGINLLESFGNDEAFSTLKPQLSALRVSRAPPAPQVPRDLVRPLSNVSRQILRIVPAFSARVRYARPNSTPANPSVIASLDVDITPYAGSAVSIEGVNFTVPEGLVEDLNGEGGLQFPIDCLPRDDITFLYRLLPSELEIARTNIKPVHITVDARVIVSADCQPLATLRWTTSLDFTIPINTGFTASTTSISMGREHRPSQLSISSSAFETIQAPPPKLDSLASHDQVSRHHRTASIPDFGVTMTFTSLAITPPTICTEFSWEVFIVNRSDRVRKLALLVLPRRPRRPASTNRPPSTSGGPSKKDKDTADAVIDDNILYAMQRNAAVEPAEIVCLSTDVRVGPLAPQACQAVELRFLPLREGPVGVDCVRVIDLGTQEHVDVRDLPSVIIRSNTA